ncbi:MAG: DNA polymerase III subunit delta' [Actinobacteria bacterium]|nr:DNA polymerase III subunit delta' [Actinomycetota bacterium]MDA2981408.1 DNA polymerase III subunit delta' [Actinomycetota bacterium]MDA2996235.1 DNA polymerase III subunit delta' [Actinomycetota bacterium]
MSATSVFDNLIDQEHVISILQEAVSAASDSTNQSQEMTHAWLFTGPPGSGRSNAALAFAAALVCRNGGCNKCTDCKTATTGSHADVELIKTEGLSIKIDEVRDLITRASWSPAVGNYRVVVIEDADRLTESAANALLKAIEEPGLRTVWLLCAPSSTDVLPTIRSRTRSLVLRTPSIAAVAKLLEKEKFSPAMADFAARVSQGHIGRARHLAKSEEARTRRQAILKISLMITDIASAFKAAQLLVDAAKAEAEEEAERRDDVEISALKEAWGQQGSKLTQGGSKAVKELEKEQKSRTTRMIRDYLDRALLDIATLYRDILLIQSNSPDSIINTDLVSEMRKIAESTEAEATLAKLEAIMSARTNLSHNAAPLLTIEALMVLLK